MANKLAKGGKTRPAKAQTDPIAAAPAPAAAGGFPGVLTLAEAAARLRVTEAVLQQAAQAGEVPARRVGPEWRFAEQGLINWLEHPGPVIDPAVPDHLLQRLADRLALLVNRRAGPPHPSELTPEEAKALMLAFAGSWKDDPDIDGILEEIYRRRGRPMTEEGA
jgi:excisionase family DNA binding protein